MITKKSQIIILVFVLIIIVGNATRYCKMLPSQAMGKKQIKWDGNVNLKKCINIANKVN